MLTHDDYRKPDSTSLSGVEREKNSLCGRVLSISQGSSGTTASILANGHTTAAVFTTAELPHVRDIALVPHFNVIPSSTGDHVLRICPENLLKRLVVSGFDRVYEITRNFRVEVPGESRLCEFTTVECYQAYSGYEDILQLCQEL